MSDAQRQAQQALNQGDYATAYRLCQTLLQHEANNFQAHFMAGGAAMQLQRIDDALTSFKQALRLKPQRIDIHAYIARCYIALQDPLQARHHATLVIHGRLKDPQANVTAAVVLSRCGDHQTALRGYQAAAKQDPKRSEIQYNLGSAYKYTGQFKPAEQAYERAIALQPNAALAHAALADLPNPNTSEQRIRRLRHLLRKDAKGEAQYAYALARELERREEYADAFAAFERSAQARRPADYDVTTELALFEASGQQSIAAPTYHHAHKPIFVMGMPRTGTTLTERILSCHSQIGSGGELTYAPLVSNRLSEDRSNLAINPSVLGQLDQLDAGRFADQYQSLVAGLSLPTPRVIDKFPINYFYIPLLRRAFSNATLLVLHRHPLDTILSNYRQLFAEGSQHHRYSHSLSDCARYYVAFKALLDRWQSDERLNIVPVSYEDLVYDPERETRRLIASCGENWEAACLDVHTNPAPLATASAYQARQSINTGSVGRWRHYAEFLGEAKAVLEQHNIDY